jgi:hypothetical protein
MSETQTPTGPNGCDAAINIIGEHFWCEMDAPHVGLAHASPSGQAIWYGAGEAAASAAAWAKADPEAAR